MALDSSERTFHMKRFYFVLQLHFTCVTIVGFTTSIDDMNFWYQTTLLYSFTEHE